MSRLESYENEDTKKKIVTIYKLVFKPDNRAVYTGRTKNVDDRLKQHSYRSSKCRLVRKVCRGILRDIHLDHAGDRVYSASEVTAMLNVVLESVLE